MTIEEQVQDSIKAATFSMYKLNAGIITPAECIAELNSVRMGLGLPPKSSFDLGASPKTFFL